jgi:hypothetical protein
MDRDQDRREPRGRGHGGVTTAPEGVDMTASLQSRPMTVKQAAPELRRLADPEHIGTIVWRVLKLIERGTAA